MVGAKVVGGVGNEKTSFPLATSCKMCTFASAKRHTMGEQTNDIAQELALLHSLRGAEYSRQVEHIASRNEFRPLKDEKNIYTCGGETESDYDNLINAARKAVVHGYRVFILPNPKNSRTADFIFESKGTYKMYDLKTIHGKSSAINRLLESVGQCNRVLLHITTEYNTRSLAFEIKRYFDTNTEALEVLILKGGKRISIDRYLACSTTFFRIFKKNYER